MITQGHTFSKGQWKKIVWESIWRMEDHDCTMLYKQVRDPPILFTVIDKTYYLIWWIISDRFPRMMGICEKMAAIVSDASMLKSNDVNLKKQSHWAKTCTKCELSMIESAYHIMMQCPFYEEHRKEMYQEIKDLECDEIDEALSNMTEVFPILLGKHPDNISIENMFRLCFVTGRHIVRIYDDITTR